MNNRPIGIFDSGLGGLTVLKALKKALPNEMFIYLGDTARVPYGDKSKEKINQYSIQISKWLINQNCKMIIVACNTASSISLEILKSKFSIPIIGVINPGVKQAIDFSKNFNIGILGTNATIKSDEYGKQLTALNPHTNVKSISCPLFVPLVEEGLVSGKVTRMIVELYIKKFELFKYDTLILGCTHYPLLKKTIQKVVGKNVSLIDSSQAIAHEVKLFLFQNNLNTDIISGVFQCFVTDEPNNFNKLAEKILEIKLIETTYIEFS